MSELEIGDVYVNTWSEDTFVISVIEGSFTTCDVFRSDGTLRGVSGNWPVSSFMGGDSLFILIKKGPNKQFKSDMADILDA